MENKKKHSSIPSNYVTLVQLQERWIKEQQRKQAEKEQQEREEQEKREREEKEQREREEREQREREAQEEREREEQERRLQEEKKLKEKVRDLKQTDKEETSETNSKSIIPQNPYRANLPNSDEPQDKAEALNVIAVIATEKETRDGGLKNDDQEKKKKKRRNKRKPKRGEEVIGEPEYGVTAEPETEKEVFEYFPARRGAWGNGIRGELRWKRKNPVANGKVSDSDDHVVMEVEQKFEDLSINNEDSSAHVAINEVSETDEDYVVVEMNGEQKFENLSINRGNEEGKFRSRVAMNGPRGWYRGPQRFCRGGWGDWNRPGGWGSWNRPRGGAAWNRHRGGGAWNRHRENGSWTWVRKGEGFDGNVRAQPN